MKTIIENIVKKSLAEICSATIPAVVAKQEVILYGKEGVLDSISLVSLIVSIEEYVESELGTRIILANEKALSQINSPFSSMEKLINYVTQMVEEALINV